jgi:hypothetical protein
VEYPPVAARPLIRHFPVELLDLGSQTIPFLAKLATMCHTFPSLQRLTLIIHGRGPTSWDDFPINRRRIQVCVAAGTNSVIHFPTPLLDIEYRHYLRAIGPKLDNSGSVVLLLVIFTCVL